MAEKPNPYWYDLIKKWCDSGRTGLSLPYLVGARIMLFPDEVIEENALEGLLADLFDFDAPEDFIRIKWCNEVKTFVVGICSREDFEDGLTFNKVFATGDVLREYGTTQQEIIGGLTSEFNPTIRGGLFSWTNGNWQPLGENDKRFILQ